MWNKPKKQNWRQTLGFIKPHKKVSKEQYRKEMEAFAEWKQRRNKGNKRASDKKAQAEYFERHPFCEVCFYEGKGRIPAVQVHEILFRSHQGKCIPENMISVCGNCHQKCHGLIGQRIDKEYLKKIKGIC